MLKKNLTTGTRTFIMKIYTKSGDKGETSLYGGKRVSKANSRIDAYGTVDELNAYIGLVSDFEQSISHLNFFISIQDKLFTIGALLAADPDKKQLKKPDLLQEHIDLIEHKIDELEEGLSPLQYFVLPGGHQTISQTHIARTVCRRAERLVVMLNEESTVDPLVIQYLNRLSDFLFVYSRYLAKVLGVDERYWIPKKD